MTLLRTSQSSAKSFCAFLWLNISVPFVARKSLGWSATPGLMLTMRVGARQPAKL